MQMHEQPWKALLRWALMLLGCLALVLCPFLPWETIPSPGGDLASNGFNNTTVLSGPDNPLTQAQALGTLVGGAALGFDTSSGDSSDAITIPGLSSIPPDSGGSGASARWGIFVLVPGVIALLTALWTLWGERDRRRSMARWVVACAGATLIPLLHQLMTDGLSFASASGPNTGVGMFIGLAGAIISMIAGGSLIVALRA